MAEPARMIVHQNGVPTHVQIAVGPQQRAVDYVTAGGELCYTVVHDAGDLETIAARLDLKLEDFDHGGEAPIDLHAAAVARTNAEATGAEIPPDPQAPTEAPTEPVDRPLEERNVDELHEMAKDLGLSGYSKLKKAKLIKAIEAAQEGQE